jgi:dTDP-4-amino-4,6-dideoxygalactose transaminase
VPGNKYEYQFNGINSRLDPMQAAILSVNLGYLDSWNARRKDIAAKYVDGLEHLGVRMLPTKSDSVFHHFITLSDNREVTREILLGHGIKTEMHYPECARISFAKFNKESHGSTSKNAEKMASQTLSLPISQWMAEKEVDYVLDTLKLESSRLNLRGGIQ